MVRRTGRGVTLIELVCAMAIFGAIMTLVLWFYGEGVRAANRFDRSTEVLRRAASIFRHFDTHLEQAQVMLVRSDILTFHGAGGQPVSRQHSYRWNGHAESLLVREKALHFVTGEGEVQKLKALLPHESLVFSSSQPPTVGANPDFVDITLETTPPSETREAKKLTFTHRIVMSRL